MRNSNWLIEDFPVSTHMLKASYSRILHHDSVAQDLIASFELLCHLGSQSSFVCTSYCVLACLPRVKIFTRVLGSFGPILGVFSLRIP